MEGVGELCRTYIMMSITLMLLHATVVHQDVNSPRIILKYCSTAQKPANMTTAVRKCGKGLLLRLYSKGCFLQAS